MSFQNSDPSPGTFQLLALSMLKGVGPSTLKKVRRMDGYESMDIGELSLSLSVLKKALQAPGAWEAATEAAHEQQLSATRNESRIVSIADPDYPALLAATSDDPCLLYVKGKLAPSELGSIAVIGTREPTSHGVIITRRLVDYLVGSNWSIVSGLALGCDAIAHQAAVDAGGHTVAVLAHGLQTVSPSKNRQLAEAILSSGGALVSEFPFGTQALPQLFVQRDKTQAGLASGVVMVQSDVKGGSLHASRASLSYGRWLAVPYPTGTDREAAEPKVRANLLIADGEPTEKADLLRCPVSALSRVIVLRGRDDYDKLPSGVNPVDNSDTSQPGLL